jgi:hypothetical protein
MQPEEYQSALIFYQVAEKVTKNTRCHAELVSASHKINRLEIPKQY